MGPGGRIAAEKDGSSPTMSAEMVSSLLNGGTTAHGSIPVEHLDYQYIQTCNDIRYLEKILQVLRSGSEGVYPHLTEFCENRIAKLDPKNRALRKDQPPATAASFSSVEWSQITEELEAWETEVKRNDMEVQQLPLTDDVGKVPPVRRANTSVPVAQNAVRNANGVNRKKSALPRDYREWDKFDVEKECSKTDSDVLEKSPHAVVNQGLPKIRRKLDTAGLSEKEREILANREKEKGNEAFKANDYEEAVAYYSRSISAMPTAAAYNNRAQAEIRLQQWHNALNDCQRVLELEPANLKALLRRATVQKHLGNLKKAAEDLNEVLQAEPQNAVAKKMMREVEEKLGDQTIGSYEKGRRILIEEVGDEDEGVPSAKPGLGVGGESTAAPSDRGDMGNAQKKSPGRGGGPPHGEPGSHGSQRRGKRGSSDHHGELEQRQKDLANGAQRGASRAVDQSGGGSAEAHGDSSRLDVPCGALPPPLAQLKKEGNQLFKNGQFADALEKYSEAIAGCADAGIDSPEDLSILYSNRAACYLKDGNSTDCIQDCTKALELQPFSLKPLLRRAIAYESLERYRKAYVDYKTVLQIDVSVQAAHDSIHRITKLLIEQDGPDWREKIPEIPLVPLSAQQHRRQEPPSEEVVQARAARAAEEAAQKAEARFSSLKQEGNELVKKGQYQDALGKYSECLTLKPEECVIYTNRALCHLKLQHFAEAKQDCDSALKLEPSNKKAFYRRALAYKGLQDYLACSSDLQEVLRLDPNVQEAERELGEVTALLRQSLAEGSPGKQRRTVPITEVEGSDEETDTPNGPGPDATQNHRPTPQPTNAYEFSQALNAARSDGNVAACGELLRRVPPETLPLYLSSTLDADALSFVMQALDEELLQEDPDLVFQHLNHLHTAERFSVVLMLLGKVDQQRVARLFERLSATEGAAFTADDVRNLANKYI
ncbi:sperm-associated antigen 1 [Arapaima gigas]